MPGEAVGVTDGYPQLVLFDGEGDVVRKTLDAEPITLGRLGENTLVVRDPLVARFHLRVARKGEHWIVQDLESAGGTRVNGVPVESARLSHGDVIVLGAAHRLLYLERADDAVFEGVRTGGVPTAPPLGQCPACWNTIARLRDADPLPDACPRCRSTIAPAAGSLAPCFVRTRFRLGLTCAIANVACVVREPMPGPPAPRLSGAAVPDGVEELTPQEWGTGALRHAAPLAALAATPEGFARAGDLAGEVRTWDVVSGDEVERYTAPGPVLALSPDAQLILVDRGDELVVHRAADGVAQWSVHLGSERGNGTFDVEGRVTLRAHGQFARFTRGGREPLFQDGDARDPVTIASSRAGAHLLVVHPDAARLRENGRLTAVLQPPGAAFHAGAVSADGAVCALALRSGASGRAAPDAARLCVLLWFPLEARVRVIADHLAEPPVLVALSDDASLVAWADVTGRVTFKDAGGLAGPADRFQHAQRICSLVIDAQRKRVISAAHDGRVRSLRAGDTSVVAPPDPPGHAGGNPRLHLSGDGQRLASCAQDGFVRVWDVSTGAEVSRWPLPVPRGLRLALAPTARRVVTLDAAGVTARVAATGQFLWSRPAGGPPGSTALAWSEDGRAVLVAHAGAITALDGNRGTQLSRVSLALPAGFDALALTPGGDLVARDPDGLALVDGRTGRARARARVPAEGKVLGLSADGLHAALWRVGQAIDLVDLRDGRIWTLETPEVVSALAVAPGGRLFAVAFAYLGLHVFATAARALVARWVPSRRLSPADHRLDALCFTPDGAQVIGGTREGPLLRFRLPGA